jgi:hypothetical protein
MAGVARQSTGLQARWNVWVLLALLLVMGTIGSRTRR